MAFGDPTDQSGGGDKSGSAKGILTQIKGLLHQYIDLGDSTPLKGEAESFLTQVDDGLDKLEGVSESPAEDKAEGEGEDTGPAGPPSPADFRSATKAASDHMKAHGTFAGMHGGTKTSSQDEEQSSEEEEKRKKSKAGY